MARTRKATWYIFLCLWAALWGFPFAVSAQSIFPEKEALSAIDKILRTKGSGPTLSGEDIRMMANEYYHACVLEQHNILSKTAHTELCACISSQMSETMTIEGVHALSDKTDEGHKERLRFLRKIYTPCLAYPVKDLFFTQCLENYQNRTQSKHPLRLCECVAKSMKQYTTEKGRGVLVGSMVQKEKEMLDIQETLNILMNSISFKQRARYYTAHCVQEIELGRTIEKK